MSLNGPSLTGLRRVLAGDKTFARVQAEASRPFTARSEDYQISAPAGLRAVLLAEMADGLASRCPTGTRPTAVPRRAAPVVLAVTATGREAEDLTAALGAFLPAAIGRRVPQLGNPAARAALAALGHRRPPALRAAPPRPPGKLDGGAAARRGRPGPRRGPADRGRARRAGPGHPEGGPGRPLRRRGQEPRRRRLRPGGHGHPPRRIRRPRRHARRLPAHRGPPDPGGVLRRRGRPDALVRRRGPALADRARRAPPHRTARTALPRNPDHAVRDVPGGDAEGPVAGRGGHAGKDRRRHRGRGHGVPGPGAGGCHGPVRGPVPRGFHRGGD